MFERFYALLLRLYPLEFRRAHGDEAAQLIRDRARHERGVLKSCRLLMDLAADLLAISLRSWHRRRRLLAEIRPRDGALHFDILDASGPRPEALAVGLVTSTLMFASFTLLFQPRAFPPTPAQLSDPSGPPQTARDLSDSARQPIAPERNARNPLIGPIAANLEQRYPGGVIGQQLADMWLAHESVHNATMSSELPHGISVAAQSAHKLHPALPLEPIGAIIAAFKAHDVVALSEGTFHGDLNGHEFRLRLLRDPRFAATVDDIVVECGNALHQDVMDRFVTGEEVPQAELRRVWQNTTQPGIECDLPIHEEFYRAVRELNTTLPGDRQVRVLLGDPPIDWDRIHTMDDIKRWNANPRFDRDKFPAELIRREVLAKNRRALIVYGAMHLQRKNLFSNYDMSADLSPTIVHELERNGDTRVFTVWGNAHLDKLQPDVASWPRPSLALIRGTPLGAADFTFYYPTKVRRIGLKDGKPIPVPEDAWKSLRMEDQADAVLYPGPAASIRSADFPTSLCRDTEYMKMRLARIALVGFPPQAERLKQICR